ncbi:MAG: peptide-methionine (S)-S-oxide reductase MsrA [Hyphomicrobiales bacterium]|jgi:peptide-methionine (S)-S-oxide reductase|nr:peptide-methionine (S)-S-oxide reductase MsrA [Hyphomicrobiales bacterium]
MQNKNSQTALFGAGCFWHIEKIFHFTEGVLDTEVGYAGGVKSDPTYEEVCSGITGHAEVVKVQFNEIIISFDDLLNIFWNIHDPTQINRQGFDVGSQYRSCVFTNNDSSIKIFENQLNKLKTSDKYSKPIATILYTNLVYYAAEEYHQKYLFR